MNRSSELPPRKPVAGKRGNAFEPPMNTDEHRIKADKEKGLFNRSLECFFMSFSVFIGVHRWLKSLCFNLLDLIPSVTAFAGVCDVSVS
jgi:hypothetical protein